MDIKSRWQLFYTGVSSGIVPSITAFSVLLVAVSSGQTAFGLILVVFFSIGIALTIILMGSLLMFSKKLLNLESKFGQKAELYLTVGSAIFILLLSFYYILK